MRHPNPISAPLLGGALLFAVALAPLPATAAGDARPTKTFSQATTAPDNATAAETEAAAAPSGDDGAQGEEEKAAAQSAEAEEEASEEKAPGSEDTGADKPLNIAAIGSIATGTTGLLTGLTVVVIAVLQVPNPLLYPFHQSDLADAEARYRETRSYEELRRAQEARAGITAIEAGFSSQAGILLTSVSALLPAAVTLAMGITQLVMEE